MMMKWNQLAAALLSAAVMLTAGAVPLTFAGETSYVLTASAESLSDMPQDYRNACDWIWQNRINREKSCEAWSTIYDQIVAGNGTLNYILIWQSYEPITLEQRQKLPEMLENAVNKWTDHLIGYDDWPFTHVNVNVVGYAVLDETCILDRQPYEVVYTATANSWLHDDMISSGMGNASVPAIQPAEPTDLSRYVHWADKNWSYNGDYNNRYDMYLHGITGMINMGGYGYHYGQILSDQSIMGLVNGTTSEHILLHEMGHGFGFPDYYGGEGESDGFPPGGFPGGENSIMMAGSSARITNFDVWFLRYAWTKLKEEAGRFDLAHAMPDPTEPATEPQTEPPTEWTEPVTEWTEPATEAPTDIAAFTDTVTGVVPDETGGTISFAEHGSYHFSGTAYFGGDESRNLSYYEAGDRVNIRFVYNTATSEILRVEELTLEQNVRRPKGDINASGTFDLTDLVLMQRWLLGIPGTALTDSEAGDMNEDGVLDIYDLSLMKRALLKG